MALINITGATVGITTAHPSRAPEFAPVIDWVRELLISYCLCLFTLIMPVFVSFFICCDNVFVFTYIYICKTQIDVQPLIDVQSSNLGPISTSQTSVSPTYVLFSNSQIDVQFSNICLFYKFSNRYPILISMAVSHFLKSTSNDVTNVYPNPIQ
jgi:hypothetical protein